MNFFSLLSISALIFLTNPPFSLSQPTEISLLMTIKSSLDPNNLILSSWSPNATGPCADGSFQGIACNSRGQVVDISLQGKGLSGQIPPEIGLLKSLSGLYLHFNELSGAVPREIGNLTKLSDLYLDVNNLSGEIPPELGNMSNLQVLQLGYNKFTGSIPSQLRSLKKLSVLALQYNQLIGAIPASLGDLVMLRRLDLAFNFLFGSIPLTVADMPILEVLDIRNNTLSGKVPLALKRLDEGFQYAGNRGLCGVEFSSLKACKVSDHYVNPNKPESFGPDLNGRASKKIPESANSKPDCTQNHCSTRSKSAHATIIFGVILVVSLIVVGLFTFTWYRRRKGSTFDSSDSRLSTDHVKEVYRKSTSPLISLEYSRGWDPLAKSPGGNGFSQEVFESFMYNVDDIESATQYFSEVNLLGKSSFSTIYKGIMKDGSVVAIKCIAKTSCKFDEAEFLKGLKILTVLKHENLLRLRGFCCSKGRGECFLIYDFVPNGNLLQYLDIKDRKGKVLEWSTRISIIEGIAKGIRFLHGSKPALVHQNISAEKVLLDQHYNPLLSDSGLHKLLADDIVFSTLKASAAMGYLAPEYTIIGRFTEKSDLYAYGMIIFQILSGKRTITQIIRRGAESGRFEDFIDVNLEGKYAKSEAAKLGKIALLCTHESPDHRPDIETVLQELTDAASYGRALISPARNS